MKPSAQCTARRPVRNANPQAPMWALGRDAHAGGIALSLCSTRSGAVRKGRVCLRVRVVGLLSRSGVWYRGLG